jgi:hypothetical protein
MRSVLRGSWETRNTGGALEQNAPPSPLTPQAETSSSRMRGLRQLALRKVVGSCTRKAGSSTRSEGSEEAEMDFGGHLIGREGGESKGGGSVKPSAEHTTDLEALALAVSRLSEQLSGGLASLERRQDELRNEVRAAVGKGLAEAVAGREQSTPASSMHEPHGVQTAAVPPRHAAVLVAGIEHESATEGETRGRAS